jgi:hypothetical protein
MKEKELLGWKDRHGGLKGFQTAYVSKYVWAKCI